MRAKTIVLISLVVVAGSASSARWLDVAEPDPLTPTPSNASASECFKASCLAEGSPCIRKGSVCIPPLVCVEGICSASRGLSQSCSAPGDCNSGDFVIHDRTCTNGFCSQVSLEGGSCAFDGDCDQGLRCVDQYCAFAGVGVDEACNGSISCRFPLSCNQGRCADLASSGSTCSPSLRCDIGNSCVDAKCVKDFTAPAGSPCSSRTCAPPLVCSHGSQQACVPSSSTSWQPQRCTSDSGCPDDSVCSCDWTEGVQRCTADQGSPSWSDLVVYRELLQCIKSHSYDRRPCYEKVLDFVQSRWQGSRFTPAPELFCIARSSAGIAQVAVSLGALAIMAWH